MNSTLQTSNHYLMPNYGELGLEITSGQGAYVWTRDKKGKRKKCLDLLCGLGVTSLGHCHPAVVKAIERQSQRLMHVSNLYGTSPMAELAARLAKLAGEEEARVFFCNSGTEANEAAGKLARIWAHENYDDKKKIVALKNSFHGRTWLSITMTGQPKMQEKFDPRVPGIEFVALNDFAGLHRVIDHDVCAVIYEVIQAEGGIHPMDWEFYREIAELSKRYNFLRIVDEVQTGVGRTGEFFAFKSMEEKRSDYPDIITLAKALGGGLPIGAVIAKASVGKYMLAGSHAATFGGNPVVCAAALAVLQTIEKENLIHKVIKLGTYLKLALLNISHKYEQKIKEVRGSGLMLGVELHQDYKAADVVSAMYKKGILIGTAGPQVVRFLPPFIVTEEELSKVLHKFEQVIKSL